MNNPATGIIQRSNNNSFFLKFHQKSTLSDNIMEPNPTYKNKRIEIVQMMLINDGYIIAECVHAEEPTIKEATK